MFQDTNSPQSLYSNKRTWNDRVRKKDSWEVRGARRLNILLLPLFCCHIRAHIRSTCILPYLLQSQPSKISYSTVLLRSTDQLPLLKMSVQSSYSYRSVKAPYNKNKRTQKMKPNGVGTGSTWDYIFYYSTLLVLMLLVGCLVTIFSPSFIQGVECRHDKKKKLLVRADKDNLFLVFRTK